MEGFRPGGYSLLPVAVKNLLIVNALFFVATIVFASSFGSDLTQKLGLFYVGSEYFKPYQFISHLFMHGSFMHIFSNMFALWMFGSVLENMWGPKRFLIYYLITGLGAAVLHSLILAWDMHNLQEAANMFLNASTVENFKIFINDEVTEPFLKAFNDLAIQWETNSASNSLQNQAEGYVNELVQLKENIPTVGASGAVFGVLLAFGMLFPNTKIYLYFLLPIKAKYFVILYGLFELFAGIRNSAGDNVAHWAHLGGMIFGYFLIKYWNTKRNKFY